MPNSYTALYTHFVFSTKLRVPVLTNEIRPRMFEYMGGICRNIDCSLVDAGGVEDHVHLLVRRHPSKSESVVVRDIKANSSRWLKQWVRDFHWQDGSGDFSVSPGNLAAVRKYFAGQEQHHRKETFKDEFLRFLRKYGVEFDIKYVFD